MPKTVKIGVFLLQDELIFVSQHFTAELNMIKSSNLMFSSYAEIHSTRKIETLQCPQFLLANYCQKVHNARFKLALPISVKKRDQQ